MERADKDQIDPAERPASSALCNRRCSSGFDRSRAADVRSGAAAAARPPALAL